MTPTKKRGGLGIPYFTTAQVATRCAELMTFFDEVKETYAQIPGVEPHLDEDRLYLAVVAYFHDVARYKWWHYRGANPAKQRLHDSKKAGLICYWLTKIAPAYVHRELPASQVIDPASQLPEDPSLMLNAHFALHVATLWLGHELSRKVQVRLMYELLWRDISAKSCLTLFELLDLSRDRTPLVNRKAF